MSDSVLTARREEAAGHDPLFTPYFDGIRDGVLKVQKCEECGRHQWPPRSVCTRCQNSDLAWEIVDEAQGGVYTWVVVHHTVDPNFTDLLPYAVALINLETIDISVFALVPDFEHIDFNVRAEFVPHDPSGRLPPHWRLNTHRSPHTISSHEGNNNE